MPESFPTRLLFVKVSCLSVFPCARLGNPVLEVAVLRAVVGPCDLLGSFPNQILPWFSETVWKHGDSSWSDIWPPSLTAPCSQNPVGGWAGRGLQKRLQNELLGLGGVWLVVSTARASEPLAVLNCGSWKPAMGLFEGTSTCTLVGKSICLGQCVKKLWTVRFILFSRWGCLRLHLQGQPAEHHPSCSGTSVENVLLHLLASCVNRKQPCT